MASERRLTKVREGMVVRHRQEPTHYRIIGMRDDPESSKGGLLLDFAFTGGDGEPRVYRNLHYTADDLRQYFVVLSDSDDPNGL